MHGQEKNEHLWKERVVVIHGTSEDDELVKKQIKLIEEDKEAMEDLRLVIQIRTIEKIEYESGEVWIATEKDPIYLAFKVELYGLDGGLKFTSNDLVPMSKLYDIINSMPMRGAELRERNKG